MIKKYMIIFFYISFSIKVILGGEISPLLPEKTIDANGDEKVIFSSYVSDIFVDRKSDKIFVVDKNLCNIKVFNSVGKLLQTIGRKGQGPGDFINPSAISKSMEGNFIVAEPDSRRFQIFNSDWKLITMVRTPYNRVADLIPSKDNGFWTVPNKGFLITVTGYRKKSFQPVLFKINKVGRFIKNLGTSPTHKNFYLNEMLRNVVLLSGPKESIFICYTIQNKIEIFKNNKLIRTLKLPLKFNPVIPKASMKQKDDTFFMELQMDKILTDACWYPNSNNGNLYIILYQGNTSKTSGSKVGQHLCMIDYKKGNILKEWSIEKHAKALDFLSDGRLVLLHNVDEEYSVSIYSLR